ncbi:MAG: class I SAM-dependent methyltransferase [Phycisphaeraceae bacterium]|nr:MAG: class I SAM-dependent methyltransferase [Phycisphaeraceae bacterium]
MALYNTIGHAYARHRRPDPRIAQAINAALGNATSVVNVGAGTGSYEPPSKHQDRTVLAVEPSDVMIRQRPAPPLAAPCVQGSADSLPLEDNSFDAAMAILTIHHWPDPAQGLRQMARVARHRVVILTWIPDAPDASPFWLTRDYFPEILAHDRTIFPTTAALTTLLERTIGPPHITPVPIPHDCIDGFLCAYWRRPECYLDPEKRACISSFARIDPEPGLAALRADLSPDHSTGRWADRNRHLLTLDALDLGYRLIRCERRPRAR